MQSASSKYENTFCAIVWQFVFFFFNSNIAPLIKFANKTYAREPLLKIINSGKGKSYK